ncbi:hypothetical protein JCM10450v2_007774 [Rhodotorula kratochvilovae]
MENAMELCEYGLGRGEGTADADEPGTTTMGRRGLCDGSGTRGGDMVGSSTTSASSSPPREPKLTALSPVFDAPQSSYTCPSPLHPRGFASIATRHRSEPIALTSAHPDFSLSLTYDTSVCNAFDLTISRLDKAHCARVEASVAPSNDTELVDWAKTRLGPDSFMVQVDGAERVMEDVPSEYLGGCDYLYRFRLNNAGRVWMNVTLLYENYESVKERVVERGSWPKDLPLLLRPLVPAPVQLDLCSSTCAPYLPAHLDGSSPDVLPATSAAALGLQQRASLPSCGAAARAGTLEGGYFPVSMYDVLYPRYRQPIAWQKTRLIAGHSGWVPFGCEWRHDGRRFSEPASCTAKEHSVMIIGDSHARVMWDLTSNRLSGSNEVLTESLKLGSKNARYNNLQLDFIFDPYVKNEYSCETLGKYDTIAISTGTWQTALNCATAEDFFPQFERMFSTWPRLAEECRRSNASIVVAAEDAPPRSTKFIFLNLPTFHPQLHRRDCRTLPRVHYWNERLAPMARENGWEVVDVHRYTKPVMIDVLLGDEIHYLRTDATEPAADDFIDRLGICGESA